MPFTFTAMILVLVASGAAAVLLRPRLGVARAALAGLGVLVAGTGALAALLAAMIGGMD
ncbi:hypothetical protein CLV92_101157 [Kineococcus xinjiangensis]|uniref:Uncharacterized protein n=1 Tax=Kineococcus xinjiangensis TaxID=512762 RepID=A0A2S6IVS5_9ACTN|nr:hypothetical protein [Kineococcus xinjiangensis]PPK98462.1 hypothetical protein CLV92_101157 [Kineococcus xinjiangensis]